MIKLTLIADENISKIWEIVVPWLVVDRSYSKDDVRVEIENGSISLWIIYNDTKPTGFIMTSFSQSPQGLTCYAPFLGGENLSCWVSQGFEQLKEYLRQKKCLSFSWMGREAWKKLVKVDSAQCFYTINL